MMLQALQLPVSDRWRLVQSVLISIQKETWCNGAMRAGRENY